MGILDDDNLAWWRTWRKRNQIAAAAAAKGNASSSCRRAGSKQQQRRKKRKIVVDPDEDGDSHMFGDNEQEDDGKDKGKKQADFMDEDFKPMALSEIKIDEQAMHEDIRILIKVRIHLFFRRACYSLSITCVCIARHHCWFCQARRPV